jgi:alpha-L-arabinofuranosidase
MMSHEWEPNDVGTDEFMDFARELGAEVHITTEYLAGTPRERLETGCSTPMDRSKR